MKKMVKGHIYIIRRRYLYNSEPYKVKVLEVTEKTYQLLHVDSKTQHCERILIEKFNNDLVIIETMGNCHFEGIMVSFFLMAIYFFKLMRP